MRAFLILNLCLFSTFSIAGQLDGIKPFLQKYCTNCHGAKKQKGDTRLDNMSTALNNAEIAGHWQSVLDELNAGNMPPEDEKMPSIQEMSNAIELLTVQLDDAKKRLNGQGKSTVMRRLNRREYINTIKDLTGVELREDEVPEDAGGGGFDTNGEGLFMSPYQFDKYMSLAQSVLDKAIVTGERPRLFSYKEEVEKKKNASHKKSISSMGKKSKKSKGKLRPNERRDEFFLKHFISVEEAKTAVVLPLSELGKSSLYKRNNDLQVSVFRKKESSFKPGTYKVRFKAGLRNVKPEENAMLTLFWREDEIQIEKQVRTTENSSANLTLSHKPKVYELEMTLERPTALTFDADWTLQKSKDETGGAWIDWVEVTGPHYKSWPPESHKKLLPANPNGNENTYVQKVLALFTNKAFRLEKPSPQFLSNLMKIYKGERAFGKPMLEAIKIPLAMVLSSPKFIYMVEKKKEINKNIDNIELANRLSFFLWSSPPDQELSRLAASKKLSTPAVLQKQIVRMFQDKRSLHFAKGFVPQWLEYERFDQIAVNPTMFPEFNDAVRKSMKLEGIHFFHTVLTKNLSSLNFLDSNFVVVNDVMRSFYELAGEGSANFEMVKVAPNSGRGGILGQGFFQTMTGNGERTSPIIRGAVTMDLILGMPSPEPPPNVPLLESVANKNSSLKEKIKLHQNQPQCHSCHKKIDPIGFGLEQFNAIGKLRESGGGRAKAKEQFETSGKLPNGSQFKDFAGMKKLIMNNYKDKFFRSFTESTLSYALGRQVGFGDARFIDRLMTQARKDNYKLGSHLIRIIMSPEFIHKPE